MDSPIPIQKSGIYFPNIIQLPDGTTAVVLTNTHIETVPAIISIEQFQKQPSFEMLERCDGNSIPSMFYEPKKMSVVNVPCHKGHVPVRCFGNSRFNEKKKTTVIRIKFIDFSELQDECNFHSIGGPILDVNIGANTNFYKKFSDVHEFLVLFPVNIPKKTSDVKVKQYEFHMHYSGPVKAYKTANRKYDTYHNVPVLNLDSPRDDKIYVNKPKTIKCIRPNQIWSIIYNKWVIVPKPKPRNAAWVWDDSNKHWSCEIDQTISSSTLKIQDRTGFSNCFPPSESIVMTSYITIHNCSGKSHIQFYSNTGRMKCPSSDFNDTTPHAVAAPIPEGEELVPFVSVLVTEL